MKTALITGANRGLGFEIARQLGHKGFHIYLTGRNESGLAEALNKIRQENIAGDMLFLDVTNDQSVSDAALQLQERNQTLDVLINNAAILYKNDRSLLRDNFDIFEATINTNAHGALRLIRHFLPLMNNPGRIINMSSGGGSMTDPVGGWSPAYCVSKTLLNSITRQLADEISDRNISVNAVCPGWVKTDMGGRWARRAVDKGAETPVWLASDASQRLTGKFFRDKKEIEW